MGEKSTIIKDQDCEQGCCPCLLDLPLFAEGADLSHQLAHQLDTSLTSDWATPAFYIFWCFSC